MRVIAGSARGMKLKTPAGRSFRPTTDRVKEALFSILGIRVIGAAVLDLFAGSGALGIEALSRGAESCVFNDQDRGHLSLVRENLRKTGLLERSRVFGLDYRKAIQLLSLEGFQADLILLDPPYREEFIPSAAGEVVSSGLLKNDGLIVVEHAAANRSWIDNYRLIKQKKYGDTMLSFIAATSEV